MDHNIALSEIDNISMGELQKQLVSWVDEKGLLNELRAYLRKKMIFLLKDTILDQTTSVVDQICVTPKLQALALLVAEYLLSQRLFYSLSVFSTEVPTITHVNKFCQQIKNGDEPTEYCPKLDPNEIAHILEAIGLSGNKELIRRIKNSYDNASDRKESLIGSIFENISTIVNSINEKYVEKCTKSTNTDEHSGVLRTINSIADLNLLFEEYHLKQYQSAVLMFIEKEQAKIKSEERAKYKSKLFKYQKNLYQEVREREQYVVKKLNEAEVRLATQKHQIEGNLKRKQSHLQELADELGHIHAQLSRREELLNSLKQDTVSLFKEKSSTNLCEEEKSSDDLKKSATKSSIQNISQEQSSVHKYSQRPEGDDRLCERKLFSDIILGLQKENSELRNQSLRHRTSIMKLKCKLAKKNSSHEYKRPLYSSQFCLPVNHLIHPSLSPISSEREHIASSNSSIKSDVSSVTKTKLENRISVETLENADSVKRLHTNIKSNTELPKEKSRESINNSGYVSMFVPDLNKQINKRDLKRKRQKSRSRSDVIKGKTSMSSMKPKGKQHNNTDHESSKGGTSDVSDEKQTNHVQNNLKKVDKKNLNMKNSIHKVEYKDQTKSEIQQTVSVQFQESSRTYSDPNSNNQNESKEDQCRNNKCHCVHNKTNKSALVDKVKPNKIMQIPNMLLDVDASEMYEGTFKDIARKMKPLEDCILYSKRVPNIYYAEPCFESASQGDIPKSSRRSSSTSVHKENSDRNLNNATCSTKSRRNRREANSPKSRKSIRDKSSDSSVVSSNHSSNSTRSRKLRKNSPKINNINIEDLDENELFRKVCQSLGVPLTPIASDGEDGFTHKYFGSKPKTRHSNVTSLPKPSKNDNENGIDISNTNLDNSTLSSLSDSSRDCATPASLLINSASSSSK